jgi:Gas vesicle protein
VSRRPPRHSTVARGRPPKLARPPAPPLARRSASVLTRAKAGAGAKRPKPPRSKVARIVDESEASLLDVIDNLLNRGVVLNADLILALANVDLVYVRLSALLCAADRLLSRADRSKDHR